MYSFACVCVSVFVLSGVIWTEEMGHFIWTFVSGNRSCGVDIRLAVGGWRCFQ